MPARRCYLGHRDRMNGRRGGCAILLAEGDKELVAEIVHLHVQIALPFRPLESHLL